MVYNKYMAKKKSNLKFSYDAPVTLTFALITIVVFLLDTLAFKGSLNLKFLHTPTSSVGAFPFSFKEPLSIVRLFLHVFGNVDKSYLICNLIFILLLGPEMENRYGSVIIGIMIFVSALFSGVLSASFCKAEVCGSDPIVFMLIILWTMMHLSRKKISGTSIAVIILFAFMEFFRKNPNGVVGVVVILAGGLCGSLFAFIASPKARKAKKSEEALAEFEDYNSPRFAAKNNKAEKAPKNKKPNDSSDDETVIGSITF